jgi:bla regulator protein BlaR1
MTTLQLLREIGSPALVRGVGYALLHSLWQGGVLALLLAGVLPLLRRQRAEVRYAVAAGALASLVLAVGLTFGWYYQSQPVALVPAVAAATTLASETAALSQPMQAGKAAPLATATTHKALPLGWLQANRHHLEAYLPLVVVAWLLGLLLMSGRLAGGLLYASRLRWVGTQALGAEWQQRLAVLARRAGVRQPVALLESARVAGPVVLGHLRPVILLPLGAVAGLSPALLEALLAHELAHIVRRDYLLNLGLAVAEVLFFYHPAVWFMANCLRAERENCCDDQAAALCGGDGLRVARALAALAELEAIAAPTPRLALAAAGTGGRGSLLARVRRLALGRPQAPTMSERLLAGSLTLVGLLGLSTGVVLAARPAQTVPNQTAPADTARRPLAVVPAGPALPSIPLVPAAPAVEVTGPMEQLGKTEHEVRAEGAASGPQGRGRRWQQAPPRRGQASTVVIEKDKKGRVVNLTVDDQRIETAEKKAKRRQKVRTVEVVSVPAPARSFERLERLEMPEVPERPEQPESTSFSFNFSATGQNSEARRAAELGLREALRSPNLNAEQRHELEQELEQLGKYSAKMRAFGNGREFHLNLSGSAASHPAHPSYHFERSKRGYVRMKFDKQGRVFSADADAQAQRNAEQAERNAEQAERNAEQAERNARRAEANGLTAETNARQAEANARRAELRARMAADAAELRALENGASPRSSGPTYNWKPSRRPATPPPAPQAPPAQQAPPAPPAPKTNELRAALRQDGLIGKSDRSFSFELNDKGGRVNGQALTPAQVARYRQLMGQPASGKGQSSSFNINVNEN